MITNLQEIEQQVSEMELLASYPIPDIDYYSQLVDYIKVMRVHERFHRIYRHFLPAVVEARFLPDRELSYTVENNPGYYEATLVINAPNKYSLRLPKQTMPSLDGLALHGWNMQSELNRDFSPDVHGAYNAKEGMKDVATVPYVIRHIASDFAMGLNNTYVLISQR